ncbi:hypothetical protein CPAR01_10831 [Colletotrichum paranaense]|uniref:Uncharacterized protein n=1 Tax=Colletotrichum paranaense TaxID=1914294 RepID=A0ABQ9S9W9_9PEZI|nr:uncharacterized protein CPAR01_10831 [Colletotrichum paranaense]KAK1531182.1 hypothetical protein CPAR01_10831 [Colletotrichum paranaense]
MKSSAIISKFCQPRDDPLRVSGPKLSRSSLSPARIPPVDRIDATGLNSGSELYWKRFSLHGAGPAEGQPSTTLPTRETRQRTQTAQLCVVTSRTTRMTCSGYISSTLSCACIDQEDFSIILQSGRFPSLLIAVTGCSNRFGLHGLRLTCLSLL